MDPILLKRIDALICGRWSTHGRNDGDPFWSLNCLVYAGAVMVYRRVHARGLSKGNTRQRGPAREGEGGW